MANKPATTATAASAVSSAVDRDWIASEFSKGIHAEQDMAEEAKARVSAPPEPAVSLLYSQIADADARHRAVVETVAVRYGHTPGQGIGGGIGETLGKLKDKVAGMGTTGLERVGHDLAAKANAIHWYAAWVHTFEELGDDVSARELAGILTEEKAHHDALQSVLNRMVARGAHGEDPVEAPK